MNKILRGIAAAAMSALMLTGAAAVPAFAAESGFEEAGGIGITVSAASIKNSGFASAVQGALNTARDFANASNRATVKVAEGDYTLYGCLNIYSNTTLDLTGVTVTRGGAGNMLRTGANDSPTSGVTGYAHENITLIGGTFDGNAGANTMLKAAHAKNFVMENVTVRNEKEGHMMEVAGVDGFTVRNCTFKDQILSPGGIGYESIQLDILHSAHMNGCRSEDLNMKNVLIEGCTFTNVPRAIGTHTAILNNPFDGVTIRNNTFNDIKSCAVQGMNWINVNITGNTINTASRGITVYGVMPEGSGTFKASILANEGGTTAHVSDSYQTPKKANINIACNTLNNVGAVGDIYAAYECQGIAVISENIGQDYGTDSFDGSGALPQGDYYVDGVRIHDNYIDIRGNGVRVQDTRNTDITSNVIVCSKNTVEPTGRNYYGVVLRDNAQADELSHNTIIGAEVNGVQIDSCKVNHIDYNRIENAGKYGVGTYTATLGKVTDNDIINCKSEGITLISGSKADAVKWNRVRKCGGYGLYFAGNCSASEVISNTTVSNGGGIGYTRSKGLVKVGSNYTSSASLTNFLLDGEGVQMGVGTAYKIVPDVRPTNAFADFSYFSSDSSVAAVDKYGRVTAKKQGAARITVRSDNGVSKSYTIAVGDGDTVEPLRAAQIETPQITGFDSVAQGVEIRWKDVPGAYGYRVFYKGASGWKGMATVTTNSYIDTDVTNGHTYTYTVRCVDENGTFVSGYNNSGWTYTYNYQSAPAQLATPSITGFESTAQGVKINWNAVPGAYGYRVFYKGANGWKGMATVRTNGYLDEDVTNGHTYTYTVRCVDAVGNFTSGYSDKGWTYTYNYQSAPAQLATPSITGFESTAQGVKIKWNAVSGAHGYRVFYKGSSGWKGMDNVTTNSYVDTDVRNGGTYTYTVRCIDANGSFVSGYNDTGWKYTYNYQSGQLATPSITGFESTAQGVKIKWNAVSGAHGYRVFYKGSSGWKGMDNVTTNSYVDTDVRNGGTYTYTVRCIDANGSFVSGYNNTGWKYTYQYGAANYPVFTLSNESNGVRISWTAMQGVYGYKVFYKNSRGGWTSMGTVTGTSYLDTDVRRGGTYTYTVRGVDSSGSYVTSYLSSGKTITH